MAPCIRPFLASAQTTLTYPSDAGTEVRYPFGGLFTTRPLRKGDFIGFYNGKIHDLPRNGGAYRGKDRYVFSASNAYVKPTRVRGKIEFARTPLALANEPAAGRAANVCAVERSVAKDVVPQLKPSRRITAVVFYACTDVPAGAELFVHYGKGYDRSAYANPEVGQPCYVKLKERQTIQQLAEEFGIAYAHVDEECFRDDDA